MLTPRRPGSGGSRLRFRDELYDLRMRAGASALLVASLLAGVGIAAAATPARVTLTTSTPRPVVDQPWRFAVTARSARGAPLPARMRLQILLGETVVGCWTGTAMVPCSGAASGTWISFRGRRTGTLTWPAESVGVRLTFQAVVVVGGRTWKVRAPVTVQPAPPPTP